jgi:hypothetical protein
VVAAKTGWWVFSSGEEVGACADRLLVRATIQNRTFLAGEIAEMVIGADT